jgi:MFS family permease
MTTPRWDARLWGALILLCGVLFLDGLDVSMVGVALPSIQSDLGLSTSLLQWVVSGYVLGYGGVLLLGGRTADLLGRRPASRSSPRPSPRVRRATGRSASTPPAGRAASRSASSWAAS